MEVQTNDMYEIESVEFSPDNAYYDVETGISTIIGKIIKDRIPNFLPGMLPDIVSEIKIESNSDLIIKTVQGKIFCLTKNN